ncbi:MAG: cytochrome c [Acidobacteria bacterium]|nr:cytochrome c [Acidobacteriota bacterium]
MRIISRARLAGLISLVAWFVLAPYGSAQGTTPAASAAPPAGNAQNGKKVYIDIGCWQCHGYSGQGGAGPKIAPDPSPYQSFSRYTRKPSGSMPPYTAKVLPDSNLADIYAFLLTIPKPPDPKNIPLLNSN